MSYSFKFRMNLTEYPSWRLIEGILTLSKDGQPIRRYKATSGAVGYQFEGSETLRMRGPIPRCSACGVEEFEVWTEPTFQPYQDGINGNFFNIDPHPVDVTDPFTDQINRRGEFGIHLDSNAATSPGSAGCIVLYNAADFKDFEKTMKQLRKDGVNRVPLDVKYNVHERTWTVVVNGDRFTTVESTEGVVFVPIRAYAERYGEAPSYDAPSRSVRLRGKKIANVDYRSGGVAYAPLRELTELLEGSVVVDGSKILVTAKAPILAGS